MASRFARTLAAFRARLGGRLRRAGNRLAARRAGWLARPRDLVREIEPPLVGDADRARGLAAGELCFVGELARPRRSPWAARSPSPAWQAELHGFAWLDDALVARRDDRETLRRWTLDWIARFGRGGGPGWRPDLAGRRVVRLLAAHSLLTRDATPRERRRVGRVLEAHRAFLRHRAAHAPLGLERIEAAAGLAIAGLALDHGRRDRMLGARLLGETAEALIDVEGSARSRNPERLAAIFAGLATAAHAFREAGLEPDPRHAAALGRAGPALRALRFGDGGLARLHGGGAGDAGTLDQALALAGPLGRGPRRDQALGVERMAAGRTVVLIDAAPPAADAPEACASTLAIEIGVGRRRLMGPVGPGGRLGGVWTLAARATAAHSTVEVGGVSSSRLAPADLAARVFGRPLLHRPHRVEVERARDDEGLWLLAEHDGYRERFGLIHWRRLNLSLDGLRLRGEDALSCPELADRHAFDLVQREGGVPFCVRFHLPPDVSALLEPERRAVRLALPEGERWSFTASGGRISLEESAHLDEVAREARQTVQIVVAGRAEAYFGRVLWRLERTRGPAPAQALAETEA